MNPATPDRLYRLYGVILKSRFRFRYEMGEPRTCADDDAFDVEFSVRTGAPTRPLAGEPPPVYDTRSSANEPQRGRVVLHTSPDVDLVRFFDLADFYVYDRHIEAHLLDGRFEYGLEIWLLGTVLAYWLERRSVRALHCAAVEVDGGAIGFLATNKGGKSSLALSFMQSGCSLVTDDVLALEEREGAVVAHPSYPQMRMWPEQAQRLLGSTGSLERVHPFLEKLRVPVGRGGFGSFCAHGVPLRALYLPERRDDVDGVSFETLSMRDALVELLRHSFLVGMIEAAGFERERFAFFARLLRTTPVRRVRYPNGIELLPRVRDAIARDASLPAAAPPLAVRT